MFECLLPLAQRDLAGFEAGLQKLLELRRGLLMRRDPEEGGWREHLSDEAVGLLAWAATLGMSVSVRCPYVPAALVDVVPPPVRACPACATPLAGDCHACGRPAGDDAIAMTFAEWYAQPREACAACGYPFPVRASCCPVCLTARAAAP